MQESDVFTRNEQTTEQQPKEVIMQQQAAEWLEANQTAIASYNQQVEDHGVFSDGLRRFCF